MPVLLSERRVTLEFSDLLKRRQLGLGPIHRPAVVPARAPGAHQSDILRYIAVKIGKLKPGEKLESDYPLLWALGHAWEEYIFSFLPGVDWQPWELTVDGVSVNCDGITACDPEYGEDVVEEGKYTAIKDAGGPAWMEQWMHMHQGRIYCYCYGPRICRWHVCHNRGDYKSFGPTYVQYAVRFSDQECRQSWVMLQNNREAALRWASEQARRVSVGAVDTVEGLEHKLLENGGAG